MFTMTKNLLAAVIICLFFVETVTAKQNKVVVIPMAGDTIVKKSVTPVSIISLEGVGNITESITLTLTKIQDIGVFTKVESDTAIIVDFQTATRSLGAVNDFAEYQLRLSGTTAAGRGSSVVYLNSTDQREQISLSPFWPGLDSGEYTLELWARGTATSARFNNGNFVEVVRVEEFEFSTPLLKTKSFDGQALQSGERNGVIQ
ncbi:MAG: hypothetical protein ACI854_002612 [Arenicella sp.]|jgi:hypothetical protein